MEWGTLFEMIDPKLMAVVAVCWCMGYVLKQTPQVPDWTIVYAVTIVSVLLVVWIEGFGPHSVIQGILCGAFSVYGHQLVKQTRERGK